MRQQYDLVYLTNTPSFYKINLCNEVCLNGKKLLLVLYGYGTEAVNKSIENEENLSFDYKFINTGNSNQRNKLKTFIRLLRLLSSIKYKKLLYAGWIAPEYNIFSFLSKKSRNVVVCESSIYDVSFKGLSGLIKKAIISRMGAALPSGKPHDELFKSINFKGKRNITGSVGIFNKFERKTKSIHHPLRYLYVGRLIEVKNVSQLIDAFNINGKPLTIVGSGKLENELRRKAKSNISFAGFIDNEILGNIYQNHDVFILPSYYEPWGLVVEEALYWGLPVIVSDRVGSSIDMVKDLGTGIIFKSKNIDSLHNAIEEIETHFDKYYQNVMKIDWNKRDCQQIKAYTSLVD